MQQDARLRAQEPSDGLLSRLSAGDEQSASSLLHGARPEQVRGKYCLAGATTATDRPQLPAAHAAGQRVEVRYSGAYVAVVAAGSLHVVERRLHQLIQPSRVEPRVSFGHGLPPVLVTMFRGMPSRHPRQNPWGGDGGAAVIQVPARLKVVPVDLRFDVGLTENPAVPVVLVGPRSRRRELGQFGRVVGVHGRGTAPADYSDSSRSLPSLHARTSRTLSRLTWGGR